jgi:8-oxo-dGTP diphosphatase
MLNSQPLVEVAVGILVRTDGHYLFTQRPSDKSYAGYWEFPGGKLEPGETIEQALKRELMEELGITILDCTFWQSLQYAYAHAHVHLNFCKITQWLGEPTGREGQTLSWQRLPTQLTPLLPASIPILEQLRA